MLTELEPEILDYAEERGLDTTKISAITENARLKKNIQGKPQSRVTNYKKSIINELAKSPQRDAIFDSITGSKRS